jgi:spore maturation protein CgeB
VKIVICGLSITSSWGNGHATTYRALARALHARGHEVTFFERDLEWYASNRDMPEPIFCRTIVYESWREIMARLRQEFDECDVVMVGSYCPDGLNAIEAMLDSNAGVKTFYDIDTPITLAKLESNDTEYLKREQVPGFDLYFSFTGGPMLESLERKYRARRAVPLYCSFDPHSSIKRKTANFMCDLSYMGTYAADRQQTLNDLLCVPAERLPQRKFRVAGPQYPARLKWPRNVERIIHLEPKLHADFYSSSRLTLNITRKLMIEAGYSPSVRLFEAAGYGAAIVSDYWPGLETFLKPGEEILIANKAADVVAYIERMDDNALRRIGLNAQERVLQEHSSSTRAIEFEKYVAEAARIGSPVTAAR